MSPSHIKIETLLSPSWRGAWTNYIFGFAGTVFHSTPTKQMQYYLELPCVKKQFQPSTPLVSLRLSRCLTASRFSSSYLTKISTSTPTNSRFQIMFLPHSVAPPYTTNTHRRCSKWSPALLSAVASITPTRCSSAPQRKTWLVFIVFSQHSLAS